MDKHDKLKKIAMYDYPNCNYQDTKELYLKSFYQYINEGCTVAQAVNGHYHHGIDYLIEENGMDKFVAMLVGLIFMIEQNAVDLNQISKTKMDILDFESGEYDSLFTDDDLILIKSDISKIKEYLSLHPNLSQ